MVCAFSDILAQIGENDRLRRTVRASTDFAPTRSRITGKRSLDEFESCQSASAREANGQPDLNQTWLERTLPANMSSTEYRATASHNLHTPLLGGLKGLDQVAKQVAECKSVQTRYVAASKEARESSAGLKSVRQVNAASSGGYQHFNIQKSPDVRGFAMGTSLLDMNGAIDAGANLNLLHVFGMPNSSNFAGKSALEVNEMMQSLDLSVDFPYDLTGKPHVQRLHTQRFIRRLSESDKYLLTHVAPLRIVRDVPDEYNVTTMWFHDVYAPKLSYWADRQQGSWTKSAAKFPSQMRGLRTEMELHALQSPGGPLQWFMQHEQMYTGIERTLCMLIKNQIINYAIRGVREPYKATASPTAEKFVKAAREAMELAGGCQKAEVGITRLINNLRSRFESLNSSDSGLVFCGVREMIAVENSNPLHWFSFLTGHPMPKVAQDDRVRSPSIWSSINMVYMDDELTPDGADVINTISTRTRWGEFAIIPGHDPQDKGFRVPGRIKVNNDYTDDHSVISFPDAFVRAFGNTFADYFESPTLQTPRAQFPRYLRRLNIIPANRAPTVGTVYKALGKLEDVIHAWRIAHETADPAVEFPTMRFDDFGAADAEIDDLKLVLEAVPGDRHDDFENKVQRWIFNPQLLWSDYVTLCDRVHVPLFFDLALLSVHAAKTSMLIAMKPGAQTMYTVLGNLNSALAFNGVTKSMTNNTDFRVAIPVVAENNITSVPAAYVHEIEEPRSRTGVDFFDNEDVNKPLEDSHKQYFVLPLFEKSEPRMKAGNTPPLVSITGIYPGTRQRENDKHFTAGNVLVEITEADLQRDRSMGALECYTEAPFELPVLFYRAQHAILTSQGEWTWQSGEGLRGDYLGPGSKLAWGSKKIVRKPEYISKTTNQLNFNMNLAPA